MTRAARERDDALTGDDEEVKALTGTMIEKLEALTGTTIEKLGALTETIMKK